MLGGEFLKYMEAFKPFLGIGLKNYAEYQVGFAFQDCLSFFVCFHIVENQTWSLCVLMLGKLLKLKNTSQPSKSYALTNAA